MISLPWNLWTGVQLHTIVVSIIALSLPFLEAPSATLALGGILSALTYLAIGVMEGWIAPLWLSPLSYYFIW